jgi:hypothetical protein
MKNAFKKAALLMWALAVAFAFAGFAAYADGGIGTLPGEVGYTPDPNDEELWFADNTFSTTFEQSLDIIISPDVDPTLVSFDLGINTIEIISYASNTYYLTLHPQYFGPVKPPYDDQYNAQYAMELQGMFVLNPSTNRYEDFFFGGFPKFPASYLLGNATAGYYAQCMVYSSIEEIATGKTFDADWNGAVVYLRIPSSIYPPAPTPTPLK